MISLQPGQLFAGRYEIVGVLGKGGFSVVYKAMQLGMNRPVALKLMMPTNKNLQAAEDATQAANTFAKRFEVEARILSTLKSNATVTVYDYGQAEDGTLFMALEYVDGRTLDQLAAPIAPERTIHIIRQILTSLKEAHHQGVLHRDIKPQNIMVFDHMDERDLVKLLDFGIAKQHKQAHDQTMETLTQHGTLVGTPRYMAPETIRQEKQLPASDLYALGLVWFEMLTGQRAIDADSSIAVIAKQISNESVIIPDDFPLDPPLRHIVNRMIDKDLTVRFEQSQHVLDALDALNAPEVMEWVAVEPLTATTPDPPRQNQRSNPPAPTAPATKSSPLKYVVLLVLVLVVGGAGYGILSQRTTPATPKARNVATTPTTTPTNRSNAPAPKPTVLKPTVDTTRSNTSPPKATPPLSKESDALPDLAAARQDATDRARAVTRPRQEVAMQLAMAIKKTMASSPTRRPTVSVKSKPKTTKATKSTKATKATKTTTDTKEKPNNNGKPKIITKTVTGPIF